jgi:diadenosine tetraphosphate (Ap4A) HIT family hydrolase
MVAPPAFTPLNPVTGCELCGRPGGTLLWSEAGWRLIRANDPDFPAFYRIVCNRHVAELSQLAPAERTRCMDLVCAVERVLLERLRPAKVNLAALGNVVPHLHWHMVARFAWDSRYPAADLGARTAHGRPATHELAGDLLRRAR